MKIHLLSGFLGSGKTTAILAAAEMLTRQGVRAAVITNDQGMKLVDGGYFNSRRIPHEQVVNGCFCCNYSDLDNRIETLQELYNSEVIFAESVGSCTDIIATVLKPMQLKHPDIQISLSVFADIRLLHYLFCQGKPVFDDAVTYIYQKQLQEAGAIILNKIDLISERQLEEVKEFMLNNFAGKIRLYQNSLNADFISHWLNVLEHYPYEQVPPSLEINYKVYGEGEAKLAWLDEELEITSSALNATDCAVALINRIYRKIRNKHLPVGHLKFLLNGETKISFTSGLLQEPVKLTGIVSEQSSLLINARIQTQPDALAQIVHEAIAETEELNACSINTVSSKSFTPGFPTPTFRVV